MARKPRAEIEITAKDKSAAVIRRAQRQLKAIGGNIKGIAIGASAVFAGLSVALLKTTRELDRIAKSAKSAGVGAETFQAWEFAASQAGVETSAFTAGLERATKTIGDAANGVGTGVKLFDRLGIAVRDVNGDVRQTDDVIRDAADAIAKLKSPAEQSAAAAELLGRTAGPKMVGLLREGSAGLNEFENKARELGIIIGGDTLEKAEQFTDQLDILGRVTKAGLAEGFSALLPTITAITQGFVDAAPAIAQFANSVASLITNGEQQQLTKRINDLNNALKRDRETIENLASPSFVRSAMEEGVVTALLFGKRIDAQNDENIASLREGIKRRERELTDALIRLSDLQSGGAAAPKPSNVIPIASGMTDEERKAAEQRIKDQLAFDEQLAVAQSTLIAARTAERIAQEQAAFEQSLARAAGFADLASQEAFQRDEQLFAAEMENRVRRFEEELAQELGFKDTRDRTIEEAEQAHQDALLEIRTREFGQFQNLAIQLAKFEEKTAKEKTNFVLGQAQQLTAGLAQSSKAAFNLNKAVSIADAVINTATGVTAALRLGPKGIPLAALIGAQGAAQIATIQSTSFGGGTSGLTSRGPGTGIPSLANDIAPTPTVTNEQRNNQTITLRLDTSDSDIARAIFKEARIISEDEDDILFSGRSRQAIEIG